MRKFELANFEPASIPKATIQKIMPSYPEILLSEDESLYQSFENSQFLKVRRQMSEVWRGTELKNSWYHRHFFASEFTVTDMAEVCVDKDLTRDLGNEYYVNYSLIAANSGVREGTSDYRDSEYCLDAVREIYAKKCKVGNHPSLAFFEMLMAQQVKIFGKKARYQIAEGQASAMITHTVRSDKEIFASMLSFKILERR